MNDDFDETLVGLYSLINDNSDEVAFLKTSKRRIALTKNNDGVDQRQDSPIIVNLGDTIELFAEVYDNLTSKEIVFRLGNMIVIHFLDIRFRSVPNQTKAKCPIYYVLN